MGRRAVRPRVRSERAVAPVPTRAIPVTVLGGYLGAGKTTLVNQILRRAAGRRIAVLVNDFGDIGIDADLIESQDGDVINLAGGCVCCSYGSDLMAALMRLPQMAPTPDRVLIECSGVALPRSVGRTVTLVGGLALDAVIVVADAQTLRGRAADRYVGDTVLGQLRDADLVVLNKTDLCAREEIAALHDWLREAAPRAAVLESERGAVAIELLFGDDATAGIASGAAGQAEPAAAADAGTTLGLVGARSDPRAREGAPRIAPLAAHHAGSVFESLSWRFDAPVDVRELVAALDADALGLARVKGFVNDRDGRCWLVQAVGRRVELSTWNAAPEAGGHLACIGARGRFDRAAIVATLERAGPGRPLSQA